VPEPVLAARRREDARQPVSEGGLHHLYFRCASVSEEVARLRGAALRVLTPPQPGEAFENRQIAFVYAGDGLNLELIDTEIRAACLPE